MFVSDEQLTQLITSIRHPSTQPQQQHILTQLAHYDNTILKALTFRKQIEFDLERQSISASHFQSCHHLISQNIKLQQTISQLQEQLIESAKVNQEVRSVKQKNEVLMREIEKVREYDAYFEVAHEVMARIEKGVGEIEGEGWARGQGEQGEEEGLGLEEAVREERERIKTTQKSLELKERLLQERQLASQEIITSLQLRIRTMEDTIESLNKQLEKKDKDNKKQPFELVTLKVADRQLIKRYQLEIQRMLDDEFNFKRQIEKLERELKASKQDRQKLTKENQQGHLQRIKLKTKVQELLKERKIEGKELHRTEFATKEAKLKEKGQQFIQSDKTIRSLKKQISQLQNKIQNLTKTYEDKLKIFTTQHKESKQKYEQQLKTLSAVHHKQKTDWQNIKANEFETFKKSCQQQIQKLVDRQNIVEYQDRKVNQCKRHIQQSDARYKIQSQQLKEAHRIIDTHSATISKLRKEIDQQFHIIEQLQKQPQDNQIEYVKIMSEMNHIINLVTLT